MCRIVSARRSANASKPATSSPGSINTASFVSSQPTTKPFLKNGATACVSIIILYFAAGPHPRRLCLRRLTRLGLGLWRLSAQSAILFMILAVLDDLMFTSKIKAAASQLGVAVAFARSSDGALAEMRRSAPSLVILDLNNPRTDPLGTVGAMKGDPALASIPTVGFASHVQTDVIDAARQAGVDEVLARSAFTARLGERLTR